MENPLVKSFEFVSEDINKILKKIQLLDDEVKILKSHNQVITREILVLNNKLMDLRINEQRRRFN
ncbi:hypothetical protein J4444_01735 [Candidatus Woesearchaeota archaeon]|nr:hypothetical protein [Candidatus Woesearchaeota archaeon]